MTHDWTAIPVYATQREVSPEERVRLEQKTALGSLLSAFGGPILDSALNQALEPIGYGSRDGLEVRTAWLHQKRIENERSIGRAYVACLLDEMCRDLGLDPVTTWRIPRANAARDRARAQVLAELASSHPATRHAAEAVWLQQARQHLALQDPT